MYDYGIKEKVKKKSETDHGGFQQQSPQRLVDRNEHTSIRNDQWPIQLKAIEAEYYFIEN